MKRIFLPFLIIPAILFLSSCEQFDPQWAGVWVDEDTLDDVVITLDFKKWEGTLTVQNSDANDEVKLTVVEGELDGDEDTMLATIKSIYQEYWDPLHDPQLLTDIAAYVYITLKPPDGLGLDWPCSVYYEIEGNTLVLKGALIAALTYAYGDTDTLTAIRQP